MVDRLEGMVMSYAWGSHTAIAELTGRKAETREPEAELWMGAHPMAPSSLTRGDTKRGLADVIAENPARELGDEVNAAYGPELPFLLKVLAAAQPLSLQAHPNAEQARAGFEKEERQGIPRGAPNRTYKDTSHKPELLCALRPVEALCGFRRARDTLRLFDELEVPELTLLLAPLRTFPGAQGLAAVFRALMTMPAKQAEELVRATASACEVRGPASSFPREHAWAVRLEAQYPGDVGVVSALLLNLVHLDVGEALYLGAGNLHAYLDGVGVEVMASSDNVLRGGLTKKHVDAAELARILDFTEVDAAKIVARKVGDYERVWDTPAREFRLSAIALPPGASVQSGVRGPEILLCTEGGAVITPEDGAPAITVPQGGSAFVPGSARSYTVHTVRGVDRTFRPLCLYRARVNLT